MLFTGAQPTGTLALYVDSVFYLHETQGQTVRQLIPDGKTDAVFILDDHPKYSQPLHGKLYPIKQDSIIGPHKKAVQLIYEEELEIVGIRLFPSSLKRLFNMPAKNFSEQPIPFSSLENIHVEDLAAKLKQEPDPNEKINLVFDWLVTLLPENADTPDTTHEFILRLYETKGIEPLETICNHSYNEYKKLQRAFSREIGITPKYFARMVRFESLHNEILASKEIDWMSLVHKYGFHDQSHLIKEFKFFTGESPKEFLGILSDFI